jgi:hypothetical protein
VFVEVLTAAQTQGEAPVGKRAPRPRRQ